MQCKEIQILIANGEALDSQSNAHAQSCPDCRTLQAFESRLADNLASLRAVEPPAYLKEKLQSAIEPAFPKKKKVGRLLYLGSGLAAAGLGLLLLFGSPQRAEGAESAFHRMEGQFKKLSSLHMIVKWRPGNGNVEDGPMRQVYELWWRPGAWREKSPSVQGGDRLKLQEGGGIVYRRLDPTTGKIWVANEVAKQPDDFSLAGIAGQYIGGPTKFERSFPGTGHETIVATNDGGWSRIVFDVDTNTELPRSATKEYLDGNRSWQVSGSLLFECNKPAPAATFEPSDLLPRP